VTCITAYSSIDSRFNIHKQRIPESVFDDGGGAADVGGDGGTERGTRLVYEHTGFTGVGGFGGFFMAQLLGRVRRTMLRVGLPPVLAAL
jgi:hypothetical protein